MSIIVSCQARLLSCTFFLFFELLFFDIYAHRPGSDNTPTDRPVTLDYGSVWGGGGGGENSGGKPVVILELSRRLFEKVIDCLENFHVSAYAEF